MSHSLQLFVYGANEIIVPHMNNFPLLRFDTPELAYDFIRKLKSHPGCSLDYYPYFVINNPQLLPNDVRKLHMYEKKISDDSENDDSENEHDGDDNKYIMMDCCFPIYQNLDLLMNIDIYNNTNSSEGFKEYLQLKLEEEEYYNSEEYHQDMIDEYNDRKKYDLEYYSDDIS
jgi:hypothetical protein